MYRSLSLTFNHDFGEPVWQTAIEPGQRLLALELRSAEEATVSFSLLSLHTNQLVFDRYAFEEEWWVSLLALRGELMLIKQYHDSQQPEKQGLLAVNATTMEVQWWRNDLQVTELNDTILKGKTDDGKVLTYEIATGNELQEMSAAPKGNRPSVNVALGYPAHYESSSPHFDTFASFVRQQFNESPVGACDYLEVDGLIVLSWYNKTATGLDNQLAVVDENGEILLREKIGTGLDALASDTFFVFENRLIFVANKTQLRIYEWK